MFRRIEADFNGIRAPFFREPPRDRLGRRSVGVERARLDFTSNGFGDGT